MRLINADALEKEGWSLHRTVRVDRYTSEYQTKPISKVPTIELRCEECEAFNKTRLLMPQPERKKDTIQKFHDYQVDWLKSHYDIKLEPQLEEMIVRFLHDTANCYIMEIDREEGEQDETD